MASMTNCSDCDYCYDNNGTYECRRRSPQVVLANPNTTGIESAWPPIDITTDCCGDGEAD